ncbi:MAG TPA: response regulator [Nitrososphaera sp.]|nr:response regulator [Nitrososphaera sp.]
MTLPKAGQQGKRQTVMICDDDPDVRAIYKSTLSKSYNVIVTSSGKECLSKYSQEMQREAKIDALLLDYRLGDMNGDEVAYKIKMINNGSTKVILITAYELEKRMLAGLKAANT